jgi:peptidase E
MATKYILVGGHPWKAPDGGKSFCEELVKGFTKPVKILEFLFARPQERWQESFGEDKKVFEKFLGYKNIVCEIAEIGKFNEQIKWADVIYVRGGDDEGLLADLLKDVDWKNELKDKAFVGSSAGADVISTYYFDLDRLKINDGLAILPLKVLVHYKSDYNSPNIDWDKAYEELENYKENLPIITLKEGEFKIF